MRTLPHVGALPRALLLLAALLLGCAATAPPALARPAPLGDPARPDSVAGAVPAAEARSLTGLGAAPRRLGSFRPAPANPLVAVAGTWSWPLAPAPAVVHRFRAPPTPWSPGHRGVDLQASVGSPVLAAGDGRIAFAGSVAGRGVITVAHPGGLRTTYEPVAASLHVGAVVRAGQRIGVVTGQPGHCPPGACLHWGLRRGADYLDPLTLLAPPDPPVLKPVRR